MQIPPSQRGVTLVELLMAVIIFGAISTTIFNVMVVQQRAFADQLDYNEAQQNGRASIALLKRYLLKAGWGFHTDIAMQGAVPVGACYNSDGTGTEKQTLNCDNVDLDDDGAAGNDRLRVIHIHPTRGSISRNGDHLVSGIRVVPAGHPIPADLAVNDVALISGICNDAGPASDLLRITGLPGAGGASYEKEYAGYTALQSECVRYEHDDGDFHFNFGKAVVADFFIDRTDPDHPSLRMRLDPLTPIANSMVVAHDIDDLQVQFGIDTTETPDGVADEWCDNIQDGACASTVADANLDGNTEREKLARTIAVRIAVVPRTRKHRPNRDWGASAQDLTIQNHTFKGDQDGYRRWIYRATIALRNKDL